MCNENRLRENKPRERQKIGGQGRANAERAAKRNKKYIKNRVIYSSAKRPRG